MQQDGLAERLARQRAGKGGTGASKPEQGRGQRGKRAATMRGAAARH